MALKARITKEQHEKLADALKFEYVEDGSGGFKLDVEGAEDTGSLKRAHDREKQRAKELAERVAELEGEVTSLSGDDARKRGDIKTLEKSWQDKLDKQKGEADGQISKLTSHVTRTLVDSVASQIAAKISTSPALIMPHIRARLAADFDGDEPKTRVLDKDGKPSALSVDDLSNEFVANKDFSAIIIASKASGGAGKSSMNGGGAPSNSGNPNQPADLSKMNAQQLAAHIKESKAES